MQKLHIGSVDQRCRLHQAPYELVDMSSCLMRRWSQALNKINLAKNKKESVVATAIWQQS